MKKLLTLILLICISSVLKSQSQFFTKDSLVISGQVIGFKTGNGNDLINFKTYGLRGDFIKKSFQLDKHGKFYAKLYQPFVGDIEVSYKNVFEILYVSTKNLVIEIDDVNSNNSYTSENVIKVKGEDAITNDLILKFKTAFREHKFSNTTDFSNFSEIDSVFAHKRYLQLEEELEFLNTFSIKVGGNDNFMKWQQNQLVYTSANEIISFPFFKRNNKSLDKSQLIKFLKQIKVNNQSAAANSSYFKFLNTLTTDLKIIVALNPKYELLKLKNGRNSFPIYLDMIDSLSTGLARDLMYYNLYPQSNNYNADYLANQYWDRFNNVGDKFIQSELNKNKLKLVRGTKPVDIIDALGKMPVNVLLKQRLIAIFENEKGKNLYIDFWGDWCIPCMREMPNYPNIINELKDEPIKFLFFSVNTSEKSMNEIKAKYKINGDFYNLSNDEIAVINNVFGFQGYPSHFLISDKAMLLGMIESKLHSIEGIKSTADFVKQQLKENP